MPKSVTATCTKPRPATARNYRNKYAKHKKAARRVQELLTNTTADLNAKLEAARSRNDRLHAQVAQLLDELTKEQTFHQDTMESNTELRDEIARLQKLVVTLEAQIASYTHQSGLVSELKVQEREAEITRLKEYVAHLETQLDALPKPDLPVRPLDGPPCDPDSDEFFDWVPEDAINIIKEGHEPVTEGCEFCGETFVTAEEAELFKEDGLDVITGWHYDCWTFQLQESSHQSESL